MTTNKYVELETVTLELRDYLAAWGIDLPFELKRRDPDEPGRERKEKMEDKLYAATMRHFRWQKKKLREILETYYPDRKTIDVYGPPPAIWDQLFVDAIWQAELMRILTAASQDGVLLFSELVPMAIDYTLVNTEAAAWARAHAGDLIKGNEALGIKGIDVVTKEALQEAVGSFVETPGYTVGDVMDSMKHTFNESRSMMIANTEITNAYSEADKLAGEETAKQFPDVPIIKTWFTNNDDRVCDICRQNHMKVVLKGEAFPSGHMRPSAHPRCGCWVVTRTDFAGTAVIWKPGDATNV